jgi:hypothetical protein
MQSIVVSECKYYNFRTNGGGGGGGDDDDDNDDDGDDDNNNNNNNNICTSITMHKLNDRAVRHKPSRYIP